MFSVYYSGYYVVLSSVWQYIGELTVAKQCTVVMTTHYIDEARRANTVSQDMSVIHCILTDGSISAMLLFADWLYMYPW